MLLASVIIIFIQILHTSLFIIQLQMLQYCLLMRLLLFTTNLFIITWFVKPFAPAIALYITLKNIFLYP